MRTQLRLIALLLVPSIAAGQSSDSLSARPSSGGEFLWPAANLFVPGLGLVGTGRPIAGLGYGAVAGLGLVLASGNGVYDDPRDGDAQLSNIGWSAFMTSGFLGAYDTFRGAVRRLRVAGKYDFLGEQPSPGKIMLAPVDPRYLRRWTTLLGLAYTAGITAAVLSRDRDPGAQGLRSRDVGYSVGTSFGASVGEEAAFRGWLLPVLHQNLGRKFWLANGLQSTLFAAGHPGAEEFALAIGGWAFYQGWLTRRNGWDPRESAFQHFWYDVAIFLASLSRRNGTATIGLTIPI